jgi:hypothetical protein
MLQEAWPATNVSVRRAEGKTDSFGYCSKEAFTARLVVTIPHMTITPCGDSPQTAVEYRVIFPRSVGSFPARLESPASKCG